VRADRALYDAKRAGRNAVRRGSSGADRRQMVIREGVGDLQLDDDAS